MPRPSSAMRTMQHQAEESAKRIRSECLQTLLGSLGFLQVEQSPILEHAVSSHLWALGGINRMAGGFVSWDATLGIDFVYDLEPWRYDLFTRQALVALAPIVILHPPTLDMLFHVVVRCKQEIAASKQRGSIAAPQEEDLLEQAMQQARTYLMFTDRLATKHADFDAVINTWLKHKDFQVRQLAREVSNSYK